ncbi:hypothetical protein BKA56DRAFT_616801 [Ilyonectria sp. MPI-CAGE-AT-0026]|nr:hypothetical protein BKA56DRAFT_616801 [Ilyonectria sp. MPI-CAGE-AT-0026]
MEHSSAVGTGDGTTLQVALGLGLGVGLGLGLGVRYPNSTNSAVRRLLSAAGFSGLYLGCGLSVGLPSSAPRAAPPTKSETLGNPKNPPYPPWEGTHKPGPRPEGRRYIPSTACHSASYYALRPARCATCCSGGVCVRCVRGGDAHLPVYRIPEPYQHAPRHRLTRMASDGLAGEFCPTELRSISSAHGSKVPIFILPDGGVPTLLGSASWVGWIEPLSAPPKTLRGAKLHPGRQPTQSPMAPGGGHGLTPPAHWLRGLRTEAARGASLSFSE